MLLCIMIPIEIANNPGHLLQSGSVTADPPAFMGNRGCEVSLKALTCHAHSMSVLKVDLQARGDEA